jgi:hypothetical protein
MELFFQGLAAVQRLSTRATTGDGNLPRFPGEDRLGDVQHRLLRSRDPFIEVKT